MKKIVTINRKQNIQGLWDNYKRCGIHVIRIAEGEERRDRRNM